MYFSAGLIPTYLLYSDLHMLDTVWVMILPLIYAPYNMLIMKTYFQSNIPDSLREAAFLDVQQTSRSSGKLYFRCQSQFATLSLFYAVGRWNSYADNKYYIRSEGLKMVQYKLSQLVSLHQRHRQHSISGEVVVTSTPEVLQAACIMFVTIPIICV